MGVGLARMTCGREELMVDGRIAKNSAWNQPGVVTTYIGRSLARSMVYTYVRDARLRNFNTQDAVSGDSTRSRHGHELTGHVK